MSRRSLLVLVLLLASCAGTTTPPSTVPPTTTTTAAVPSSTIAETAGQDTPSSTAAAETTTRAPEATTTTVGDGESAIRIDEIVFAGGPYLIISNQGSGAGTTAGYWICQFPSYYELPAVDLLPGEKLAVQLGTDPVPDVIGVVATIDVSLPIGDIVTNDGELGLYSENAFNSADAIVDYVEWGMSGHARSEVAVQAGIWETGGFVGVPEEALAIVAQFLPSVSSADWFAEIGG